MRNIGVTIALSSFLLVFGTAPLHAGQSEQALSNSANQGTSSSVAPSSNAAGSEDSAPGNAVPAGHMACWKQAGLSKSTVEQRKSIVESAKKQIGAVENDSTLTPGQQKQQIRNVRLNTRQEVSKLITPEQQQALRQCRQERASTQTGAQPTGSGDASGLSAAPQDSPAPQNSADPSPSK